jgi:hypothetical protein
MQAILIWDGISMIGSLGSELSPVFGFRLSSGAILLMAICIWDWSWTWRFPAQEVGRQTLPTAYRSSNQE